MSFLFPIRSLAEGRSPTVAYPISSLEDANSSDYPYPYNGIHADPAAVFGFKFSSSRTDGRFLHSNVEVERPQLPLASLLQAQQATYIPSPAPGAPPSSDLGGSRKRPKYTRSKKGCLTCRSKKIKCDEQKPLCTRCKHGKRECTWPESVLPRRPKGASRGVGNEGDGEDVDKDRSSIPGRVPNSLPVANALLSYSRAPGPRLPPIECTFVLGPLEDYNETPPMKPFPISHFYATAPPGSVCPYNGDTYRARWNPSTSTDGRRPSGGNSRLAVSSVSSPAGTVRPHEDPYASHRHDHYPVHSPPPSANASAAPANPTGSLPPSFTQPPTRHTIFPTYRTLQARSSGLPEWIAQDKDPTPYSKGTSIAQTSNSTANQAATRHTRFLGHCPQRVRSPNLPEWIDQDKDPTTSSEEMSITQFTDPAMNRTVSGNGQWRTRVPRVEKRWELPEQITQAKDPTTYVRGKAILPLIGPKIEQRVSLLCPNDADSEPISPGSSVAIRIRSFMSRISNLVHPRSRRKHAQRNDGSPLAVDIAPTFSTLLRPSFSATTGPSTHDGGSAYHVLFQPDADLRTTLPRSSEPPEWIPQAKDPTSYSDEAAGAEPPDPTVKGAMPTAVESSESVASLLKSASVGTSRASLTASEEGVRDLSGLIERGSMIYAGTYSDVYLGTCGTKLVAVKVIKSPFSEGLSTVRRRVRREVGTASRFDHPNVLAVYGEIEADWCPLGGIVTTWCPNGDASKYIHREDVTALARLQMVRDVTAGLEYIHNLSVVHGDLKPANILIDALGNPLICDFGLVRILDTEQPDWVADNTTTVHSGTIRFLAYELAQDPPEPRTMASDVHALGCVTYEFIYLKGPYSARRGFNAGPYVFGDIRNGIPPAHRPPSPLFPPISALWSLLEQCWDKEPEQRPDVSTFQSCLMPLAESDLEHLYTCQDIVIPNV